MRYVDAGENVRAAGPTAGRGGADRAEASGAWDPILDFDDISATYAAHCHEREDRRVFKVDQTTLDLGMFGV